MSESGRRRLFLLNIVNIVKQCLFHICPALEIGRRRLFPTEHLSKALQIVDIYICIALLLWIQPQAPFPIAYVVKAWTIITKS